MKRDPYIPAKSVRRVEIVSRCRGCSRTFVEIPGDGCDGYCRVCDEAPAGGYQPAYDHSDEYFH